MNIKLSVIVPCLNAADTLATQLEALARQSWSEPWEVVIADNGSVDASISIARSYSHRFRSLRIVDASARQGQSFALNAGVKAAQADSVAFCDADDEVAPGWLAAIGDALKYSDFVASRFDANKLNSPHLATMISFPQEKGLIPYTYTPYLPFAGSCGMGVKRSIHEAVGGFDERMRYCLDTDYCWRIQLLGVRLNYVPEALVHIRSRTTPIGGFKQARRWGEWNVLLIKEFVPRGMPKPAIAVGLKRWWQLIRCLPRLASRAGRARWVWALGYRVGQLIGSMKYRIVAL